MKTTAGLLFGVVLATGACGGGKAAAPEPAGPAGGNQTTEPCGELAEPVHLSCNAPGLYRIKLVAASEHQRIPGAFADAAAHFDAASAAFDAEKWQEAAHGFLDCAADYRSVPEDSSFLDAAVENAGWCYKNAAGAFGMAGSFASEGKALFEAARQDDPRLAAVLDEILADPPHDCAP